MTNERDPTSIGSILLHMGLITDEQLWDALLFQKTAVLKQPLGDILVDCGYCTRATLDMAAEAQLGLRSEKKVDKAAAVATVAQARKGVQQAAVQTIVQRGRDLVEKLGDDFTPTPVFTVVLADLKR